MNIEHNGTIQFHSKSLLYSHYSTDNNSRSYDLGNGWAYFWQFQTENLAIWILDIEYCSNGGYRNNHILLPSRSPVSH